MSWTELQPIVRTSPRVKAWIRVTAAGVQLNLTLSESYHKELGKPTKCAVSAGSGENAGKLRVVFSNSKEAPFAVVELKHMARVILPTFEGLPDGARESEPCAIATEPGAKTTVIVALPVEAWERQVAKPAPVAAKQPGQPAPAKPNGNGAGKVDIEAYLQKKGHKVTRMSSSQFMIDGEHQTIAQALRTANNHRAREQLRPLHGGEIE